MTPSVANIKSFFSNTPVKMQYIIQDASDEITITDMEQIDTDDTSKQKRGYGIIIITIYVTSDVNYRIFHPVAV